MLLKQKRRICTIFGGILWIIKHVKTVLRIFLLLFSHWTMLQGLDSKLVLFYIPWKKVPIVLYSHLRNSMNEQTHFFIKIYFSHFILKRVNVSVVYERWVETGTDCYIDPTSSPDHSTLCYLQEPTEHFFCILTGVAQPGVAEGNSPQGAFSVCKMVLTLTFLSPTDSTAVGICLYSFITSTCFPFLFTQVHLWLMARSRVSI